MKYFLTLFLIVQFVLAQNTVTPEQTEAWELEPQLFGADGTPVASLRTLVAHGISEEGVNMKIDVDVANVTRPLLSVFKMTNNGHRVNFDENGWIHPYKRQQ